MMDFCFSGFLVTVTYQLMPTSLARQPLADDEVVGVYIQTDSDHS